MLGSWNAGRPVFTSGKRDLNPRHPPWQGGALPTELFPRVVYHCERRDLNPQALSAPDPKSGVSAKFHHSRLDSIHDSRPASTAHLAYEYQLGRFVSIGRGARADLRAPPLRAARAQD